MNIYANIYAPSRIRRPAPTGVPVPIPVIIVLILFTLVFAVYCIRKQTTKMGQKLYLEKSYAVLKVLKQANRPMNVTQIIEKLGGGQLQSGLVIKSLQFLDKHGFVSTVNPTKTTSIAADKTRYRITSRGADYLADPSKYRIV